MLKKTSIYVAPELDDALARRAEEDGISKAEFIRRQLAASVQRPKRPKPRGVGIIKGGPSWWSQDVDRALRETGFGEIGPDDRP